MIRPSNLQVRLGGTATFQCYSYLPHMTKWTFNKRELPLGAYTHNQNMIVIPRVTWEHEGAYECLGIAKRNGTLRFIAVGKLKITG